MSLFIYLFYRTEKTVVNDLLIRLISLDSYARMKDTVTQYLPLKHFVIYSLPEGLWIFCITLTSRPYMLHWGKRRLDCVYVPLIYCIGLEIFQLLHFANGRFDPVDIGMSMLFWLPANYFFRCIEEKQNLLQPINLKRIACFASYGIVYLSHVLR
jgi:hypothetical protein